MLISTTGNIEGKTINTYYGIVAGEIIIGANIFKDIMAGFHDFFGGRAGSYEKIIQEARETAIQKMTQHATSIGANAIIGVKFDYETIGQNGSMLMVTATGTAIRYNE